MPLNQASAKGTAANPGYAALQIAKALTTSETHADEATRERAREKIGKWVSVIQGMMTGSLAIGTRQPIQGVPVWATPEVVTGGFATSRLLAGGPLQAHEEDRLRHASQVLRGSERQALNTWFLSEVGFAELTDRLRDGCYDITVPEEGALLIVAWLAANGHAEAARNIIDVLSPHFGTLRFYPCPVRRPLIFSSRVFVETVGTTLQRIRRIRPNAYIMAQREAVQIWTPLYDMMVGLFLETVSGDLPTIRIDAQGRWVSPDTRKFFVVGGWPCQLYPEDWKLRALALCAECEQKRSSHALCGKPKRPEDTFVRLEGFLRRCANDPFSLTGRDVGMIRLIIARHITKCGRPQTERFRELRAQQARSVAAPMFHEIATVIQQRLAAHSPDGGIDSLESVLQPVTGEEAQPSSVPAGTRIPPSISQKVARCLYETASVLVERGIITSGETLARVIPQFTSALKASSFDDVHLRNLYAAIYRAFRRRRSLLLLNLEKQVQIEELPWVAVIEPFRRRDLSTREISLQTLKEITVLTLAAFPQAIIPNKLLQELQSLAKAAELDLPLVEELAADIFMDDFSPKFTVAARRAAELLGDSLYAKYFGLECATIRSLPVVARPEPTRSWFGQKTTNQPNPLVELCIKRAGLDTAARWDVARNGMIIEQAQILTTHNLAVLFSVFGLAEELPLDDMAQRCFRWICRRQQAKADNWHATLIMLKNTAYAWRQMVFYLSSLPVEQIDAFLTWADEHLREQNDDFRQRFAPALRGLVAVRGGHSLDHPSAQEQGARRFLGWTKTRHWLLPEPSR